MKSNNMEWRVTSFDESKSHESHCLDNQELDTVFTPIEAGASSS